MAIEVNLEKYGYKKKGFLGFSWTAFFFNFFVPLFRLDFLGFFIFISPYLIIAVIVSFILITGVNDENTILVSSVISLILKLISRLILPFYYNKMYTRKLLKQGYLPPVDDDYSNAILKGTGYLEYTNEDLLDEEKLERYRVIIEEYNKERKKDNTTIIIVFALIALLTALFFFMASYS